MELNPIIIHEMRTRWRGWRDFAIMFVYASLLALAVGMLYAGQIHSSISYEPDRRMAAVGHQLFIGLTITQMLGWMLLSPSLTATSIANEREHGMLDLLLLTPLGPWRVASGKLLATLVFIFLLMLAPLPILSLCFLMGGVSPGEFRIVVLLQFVTAATGAVIGLFTSAWCRRVSTALGLAFTLVFSWGCGSVMALAIRDARWFKGTSLFDRVMVFLLDFIWRTNPAVAAVDPYPVTWSTVSGLPFDVPAWAISVALQVIMALLLFWSTLRALRQPLQEPHEKEPKAARQRGTTPLHSQEVPGEVPAYPSARSSQENASATTNIWWEHPLHTLIRCANPILQRELQRKLRWRQPPRWVRILVLMIGLALGYGYLRSLLETLNHSNHTGFYWSITTLGLLILVIAAAVMGAVAFAREREANTWEPLQMSLLTPREIIRGKLIAALLSCGVLALIFWLLAAPAITGWRHSASPWREITVLDAASAFKIAVATIWF
ncbi:MAG: ABC transporter permease, partial [Armatimonadota bacterium]|nr:ABC transporter permease [Armatimonadota bacterium]